MGEKLSCDKQVWALDDPIVNPVRTSSRAVGPKKDDWPLSDIERVPGRQRITLCVKIQGAEVLPQDSVIADGSGSAARAVAGLEDSRIRIVGGTEPAGDEVCDPDGTGREGKLWKESFRNIGWGSSDTWDWNVWRAASSSCIRAVRWSMRSWSSSVFASIILLFLPGVNAPVDQWQLWG